MSDPFVGEIKAVPYNFAPVGWFDCDGRLLSVSMYQALFAVIGITYGGDGRNNFALPDLRGAIPFSYGQSAPFFYGESIGSNGVSMTVNQMPQHTHAAALQPTQGTSVISASISVANGPASASQSPNGGFFAQSDHSGITYAPAGTTPTGQLSGASIAVQGGSGTVMVNPTGQGLPFSNLPSYVALRYIIAYEGVYPVRP